MTTGHENLVTLQPGMDVYASDGEKVGTIVNVTDEAITVEKGFFFPSDHIIPITAIDGVGEDDHVYLRMTKDAALNQQWETTWDADTRAGTETAANFQTSAHDAMTTTDEETTRVPVYEEELTPVKRPVDLGAVRIEKEVVTENRTIEVPVTEERVRITHVSTERAVSGNTAGAFEEGYVEVPLTGEEVSMEKTVRKTGEVLVEKEAVQRQESVGGTVRREEVHVDDETVTRDAALERRRGR
jgi:uncharacterized protein (TIGR02271 family)